MTPQEQQLIDQLFDRLARAESASRRDPEAVRAINAGLDRAPHALYVLVQTVLLQEEALKQADQRIRELESGPGEPEPARGGGSFLDGLRGSFGGRRDEPQRSPMRSGGGWNPMPGQQAGGMQPGGMQGQPQAQQPAQGGAFGGGGGSFLGTAAAAAAGMVGGSLLMNSMKGMFGGAGEQGKAQGAFDSANGGGGSPWDRGGSDGDLSREAGLNDIGRSGSGGEQQHAGLFGGDQQQAEESGYLDDDYGYDDSDTA